MRCERSAPLDDLGAGEPARVSWTVDTTAPELALPGLQTVDATSRAGAVVDYAAQLGTRSIAR